ncbi:hypothetical protein DSO57_1018470 [Entomophthora muscae]|uniref:Uncharacterized protein n=1 Tax=Entomophthora muscae TaxID=34485 RepID=A0ACC2S6G3_9FUNG|nr:hypothetical protein DSO57_1018470 [Entomophthora muscae]
MYAHLKLAKRSRAKDTKLPAQSFAPRKAKPVEVAGKEEIQEENVDHKLQQVLVPFVLATFYANYATHVAKQLYLSPPVVREQEDHIHWSFLMSQEALVELMHAKRASKWTVTAYKDAQLVCLDSVFLSGVYCVTLLSLFRTSWQCTHSIMYRRWAGLMRLLASAFWWCHGRFHHAGYYLPKQEGSKSRETFIKIDQVNRFKSNNQLEMGYGCSSLSAETGSPFQIDIDK